MRKRKIEELEQKLLLEQMEEEKAEQRREQEAIQAKQRLRLEMLNMRREKRAKEEQQRQLLAKKLQAEEAKKRQSKPPHKTERVNLAMHAPQWYDSLTAALPQKTLSLVTSL